jgi:hypothetical protein
VASGAVIFDKIPLGDVPGEPVTAEVLDRVQQAIVRMAAQIQAPTAPNVVTTMSDYQVTGNEDVIHVDAQRGPVKITLLQPSSSNRPLTIKQVNLQTGKTQVNQVTVVTKDGSATIAGARSYALDTTGSGSVSLTADNSQHWPSAGAGGNPPVPPPTPGTPTGGLVYVAGFGIQIIGNVISWTGNPNPPPAVSVVSWSAPVPYGTNNTYMSNTTGTESWAAECMVDFTSAPSLILLTWWFEAMDSGSNGTFRIRVGGSADGTIDGAVVATWNETSTTMAVRSITLPLSSPGANQRVTLTTQSTSGKQATIGDVNLNFVATTFV